MADFNDTGITPIQAGETTKSPISPPTTQASGLGAFALGMGQLAKIGTDYFKDQKDKNDLKIVNEFNQAQLKISEAVDQGLISSAEGRTRMRSNFQRYSANSPALMGDFAKVQNNIVSTAGLGKVVAEGTKEEQLKDALRNDAAKAGWLPQDIIGTPKEEEYVQNYLNFQRAGDILQRSTAEINNLKAKVEYDSSIVSNKAAKINLSLAEQSYKAKNALADMAGAFHNKFATEGKKLLDMVTGGKMTADEAIFQIDQQFSGVQSAAGQVGAFAGGDDIATLVKPIETVRNSLKDFLSGKITKEVLDNKVEVELSRSKLAIVLDPKHARTIATSNLFGNSANLAMLPEVTGAVVDIMATNSQAEAKRGADILPENKEQDKVVGTYLSMVKNSMNTVSSGKADENTAKETETNVKNILTGMTAYSAVHDDPKSFNRVADFIASDDFYKFTSKHGGVPTDIADHAKNVVRASYQEQVLPLIRDELKKAGVNLPTDTNPATVLPGLETDMKPSTNFIEPKFIGSGVTFVSNGDMPQVKAQTRELNSKVAPIINRLIRMTSHLEGNNNYKEVWEKLFAPTLGNNTVEGNKE